MSNLLKNILTILGTIIIIAQCLITAFFINSSGFIYMIGFAIFGAIGLIFIRFAYQIAKHNNKIHMRRFKKYEYDENSYEPSNFAIWRLRISGIILVVIYEVLFIFYICSIFI